MKKRFDKKVTMFLVAVSFCLIMIFLFPKEFSSSLRKIFLSISRPFQKTLYILSNEASQKLSFFSSISNLKRENERLLKENHFLKAELASFKETKRENEILRRQLGLIPKSEFSLESSFVIGQDYQKLGSWIIIDKGSSNGIKTDMPVIIDNGILIGKIDEVWSNSSKVDLLSNSKSAVNALDVETGAKGILKGEYGLGLLMDMVSQNEILNVGDDVVTSGLGGILPKGLFIGKVQEVKTSEDQLFQKAVIVPGVKYSEMEIVFVIKN